MRPDAAVADCVTSSAADTHRNLIVAYVNALTRVQTLFDCLRVAQVAVTQRAHKVLVDLHELDRDLEKSEFC